MTSNKRRRGRPPGSDKAESLLAQEAMRNRPENQTSMTTAEQEKLSNWIKSMDVAEQQVLSQFKYSQTTSKNHAYTMASLDHEIYDESRDEILKIDAQKRGESQDNKLAGGVAVRDEALRRAEKVCELNKILLERAKPFGPLSMSDVARKISSEWEAIPSGGRLLGEPPELIARGIGGNAPSRRTITNYIKAASPFREQRVGKTSTDKNS